MIGNSLPFAMVLVGQGIRASILTSAATFGASREGRKLDKFEEVPTSGHIGAWFAVIYGIGGGLGTYGGGADPGARLFLGCVARLARQQDGGA
jgi:hypothetical protein